MAGKRSLVKLNRYIAYALIPITLFLMISGFRMTGTFQFLSRGAADLLHRVYLHILFLVLFTAHIVLSVRIALRRKRIGGGWVDGGLVTAGVLIVGFFTYLSLRVFYPWWY